MTGTVSKLVRSFGSAWGRIRPSGESRSVFFSRRSLANPDAFASMSEGDAVEFDEEPDRATGSHAYNVRPASLGKQ